MTHDPRYAPPGNQFPYQGQPGYGTPQAAPGGAWAPEQPQAGQGWGPGVATPQAPAGPPQVPGVSMEAINAAYEQSRKEYADSGKGVTKFKFVDFKPPKDAGTDWTNARVGSRRQHEVVLVAPKDQGPIFALDVTHFYKSRENPKGASVICAGKAHCPICLSAAFVVANGVGDAEYQRRVKDWSRSRTQVIYQVLLLDDAAEHQYPDGTLKPLFVRLPFDVHSLIIEKLQNQHPSTFFNPQQCRSLILTKTKDGDQLKDINTRVDHTDVKPLNPWFWGVLNNTFSMSEVLAPTSSVDRYVNMLKELQMPFTPEVNATLAQLDAAQKQSSQTASYSAGHNPPQAQGFYNPYGR